MVCNVAGSGPISSLGRQLQRNETGEDVLNCSTNGSHSTLHSARIPILIKEKNLLLHQTQRNHFWIRLRYDHCTDSDWHWRFAPCIKRVRTTQDEQVSDKPWWCGQYRMSRAHVYGDVRTLIEKVQANKLAESNMITNKQTHLGPPRQRC
jgi:hypothetical protein